MIRDIALKSEPTKPAISQVQMHFLTQPPFGSNTKAIAHDQHPDEQLRIDRGAAHSAVERRQMFADVGQVDEAVDRPEEMICRHMLLKAEAIEKLFLHHRPLTHHQPNLQLAGEN